MYGSAYKLVKSFFGFQFEYLNLTLTHSKGQGQSRENFDCEYLVNAWQIWHDGAMYHNAMMYDAPRLKLSTYGKGAFSYAGQSVRNSLPNYLKDSSRTLVMFKRWLRTFLFSKYLHTECIRDVCVSVSYINLHLHLQTLLLSIYRKSRAGFRLTYLNFKQISIAKISLNGNRQTTH